VSDGDTGTRALNSYLNHPNSTTRKKTKQTTAKPAQLYATLVSQRAGFSQGQSWCTQDARSGKEERDVWPLLFVLSRAFWWLHPQAPRVLSREHHAQLWSSVLVARNEHFCW